MSPGPSGPEGGERAVGRPGDRRSAAHALPLLLLLLQPACEPAGAGGGVATADARPATWDWLIARGTVVDGSGAPGYRADVLVRDGRIGFVGRVDPDTIEARGRFDATGLLVTPGFIDLHAHGDPLEAPGFDNFLAMGVTTIVLGQDGSSPEVAKLHAHLASVDAARPAINVAWLVGHATIRIESGVGYGDPDREGLRRMRELVEGGLEAGAFGLSTGLEYDPGSRAGIHELAVVAGPVAVAGGIVASHLRSEDGGRVETALRELIEQGRRSGARVHASHLKIVLGRDTAEAAALLADLARARAGGVPITADLYPYTASYTGIGILFPTWARPPHDYAAVVRTRRGELAAWLRRRVEGRNGPDATLFGSGEWAGRTLAEVAAAEGRPFEQVLVDLGPDGASAAYFVMDEEVMLRLLRDPRVAVSSDGSPTMLHPRGYGSFARVIRRWVVEKSVFGIEEAVRRMSGLPATILRLDDPTVVDPPRGRLREGWAADLLAFEPTEVRDRATFEQPHVLAEGMRMVWVAGRPAWRDGAAVVGPGNGRVLRASW